MKRWNLLQLKRKSPAPQMASYLSILLISTMLALCSASISSSEEQNVQKVRKGDPSVVVAVSIPDKSTVEMSFPHLKFVNDSSEFHDEDERIAKNGTMISGVAARFGKRSIRDYPSNSQLIMMSGGVNPYNNRLYNSRLNNRFDNRRNSLDSADGSTSSSSWGGKWFNQLRRRTSMMMNPMMSSYDRQQMYQNQGTAEEPDMAATFLSSGGGGWGQSSHYGKAGVNKSAVGLLGFLSLLSLIQNVLNQTQTMNGRRRRDVSSGDGDDEDLEFGYDWDESVAETSRITPYLLPMLNVVTFAQQGQIAVECTLQPICQANKALTKELGEERGKIVGQTICEELSKTLKQAGKRWKTSDWDIGGRVVRAGMAGRNGKNCLENYKCCKETARLPLFYSKNVLSR